MSDLIPTTTDDEVWRYSEAANLASIRIDPAIVKGKALKYNPITGRNDILMPLTNGGYTKIGDEEVVLPVPPAQENISEPNQVFDQTTKSWVSNPAVNLAPAPTVMSGDNLPQVNLPNANLGFVEKRSPLRIEMTQPNDARFAEFQSVIGTADAGPTMADYEAAGFTPDEVSTFQTQAFEATMPADAMVPTPLNQAQIDQYVQEADSEYVSSQPGLPEIAVTQAANIVSEVGKGLARGTITEPANFLKDSFGLYDPLAFQLVDPQTGEFDPKILFMSREEKAALDEKMAAGEMPYAVNLDDLVSADPGTPIAGLAGGIAQFAGAYAGLGKLFRLNKGLVTAAGRGAGADFLAFGGDEGRLTDMLLEMGVPDAMVPDFFKTDPNDPDYIGRFKTALEGAGLGAMIETIGPLYRAIKNGDMSPQAVSQLLSDGKEKAKRFMVQQIDDAEQRVANNSGTLYSNPVGPLVDQALVASRKAAEAVGIKIDKPLMTNPIVDDLPMVDPQTLIGKRIFPIQADLTRAGGEYTGIDSSTIDIPIALQGGPDFPLLQTSKDGSVVWAVDAKGVTSKKLNKDAEYALVVAMSPDSHKTNATVNKAMLDTTLAYVRDGRLSAEAIASLDAVIKAASDQPQLKRMGSFPGLSSPDAGDWIRNATFEERNRIMVVMSSPTAQDLGAPNLQKILDATVDPRYVGLNSSDSIMLIEIDRTAGAIKLGEGGTVPHLSYEYGLKGKPIARVPFNAAANMFPDWFKQRAIDEQTMRETGLTIGGLPTTRPPEFGRGRAFYLAQPVQEITQEIVDNMKAVAMTTVKSPLQAKLLVNALDGSWATTSGKKTEGGISVLDWLNEAKASPESATLTIPGGTNKEASKVIEADIKSGKLTLYKLKDSRTYFGISKDYNYFDEYGLGPDADYWKPNPNGPELTPNETALVSVVSNDFGAKGIGATTVMKAIEDGVTVLDCFAVKSSEYPTGYLPNFYSTFGFRESGRITFDPKIVLNEPGGAQKLKDMETAWAKKGWIKEDGYPDIVVMKWTGESNGRSQFTRRFVADSDAGAGAGSVSRAKQQAGAANGQPSGVPSGVESRPSNGSGASGNVQNDNRGSATNRLADVGRELFNATDTQLKNLGIDPARIKALKSEVLGLK